MFSLFLIPQNDDKSAPVVVWLQGGPGGSSLFGLFNENGPLVVDSSGKVSLRKINWNTDYNMLYIDNPVSKCAVPCGLVVRIRRSHRRGRGSIPRMGDSFLFRVMAAPTSFVTAGNKHDK